jgi:uncharacterized integral membrane protein
MSRRHPEPEPEPPVGAPSALEASPYSPAGEVPPADPAASTSASEGGELVSSPGTADTGDTAGAADEPASSSAHAGKAPKAAPKQTLAGRVWVALAVAAVLLVLVIIFIAENTKSITISFLGAHGHISEALALLLAVVVGIVITLLVGTARILQLSLEVRRQKRTVRKLS